MPLKFKNTYSHLPRQFYTKMTGEKVSTNPVLLHFNHDLGSLLNFNEKILSDNNSLKNWVGGGVTKGSDPLAMVYAGHQFGHYVPQLGDGRALLIGQIIGSDKKSYDIHLKGSGKTPYSRMGDGRAVLRSSIREYLCGEALHALQIPTTRALALIATNEIVFRETPEPGALVIRIAESHIRFGNFEYFHYQQDFNSVKILADYVIENYFPDFSNQKNKYLLWFEEVVNRTAKMIAKWQAVGFCHGVMNTDNMSILGLTIDYGPFGFMENYNSGWICNHSDTSGRYAYYMQPAVANWNLHALAYSLQSMMKLEEMAEINKNFMTIFEKYYNQEMAQKLGFKKSNSQTEILQIELLKMMEEVNVDYTLTFSYLTEKEKFLKHFNNNKKAANWLERYFEAISKNDHANIKNINPRYILRNWVAEKIIREAEDNKNYQMIDEIFKMLSSPFTKNSDYEKYAKIAPKNMMDLCVSCSS